MSKRKYLYSFETTDLNGKKRNFALLKPNRREKESGDLYYASKLSEFISAGILPKILWDKLFKNNGGTTSEKDKEEYASLWSEFVELTTKSASKGSGKADEKPDELARLESRLSEIKSSIQELEISQVNAFENTAEAKARNASIAWWTTAISAEKDEAGEWQPIFKEGSIDDKLDSYEEISESDEFLYSCLSRLNYLVTVWYLGGANSEEDFKKLDKDYDQPSVKNQDEAEEGLSEKSIVADEVENKDIPVESGAVSVPA
jgi:hypothetical protein